MSSTAQLCLLAALLCLPIGCLGGLAQCSDQINMGPGPPEEGINNYKAYKFDDGGTADGCVSVEQVCRASIIPNTTLTGRTWFITNIKPYFGLYYDTNIIEDFRIQCPRGTFLHLYVQSSDLPPAASCSNVDSVSVQATGLSSAFCGTTEDVNTIHAPNLQNNGLGKIFADGRASITFCSNNQDEAMGGSPFTGFVMRASCLNPFDYQLEGCVDFAATQAWDPEFANIIFNELADVEPVEIPHRRRRNPSQTTTLVLTAAESITFSDRTLVVRVANGTADDITHSPIGCLITFSTTIGTRYFYDTAPLTFFGPGKLEVDTSGQARLEYTIPDSMIETTFLPGPQEMDIANIIYDYIYRNFIDPYPVIDETVRTGDQGIFPLPSGEDSDFLSALFDVPSFRPVSSLGFVQEDIQSDDGVGSCKRAALVQITPTISAGLPHELINFCQFFDKACDLTLRTACRELLSLGVGYAKKK